MATKYRVIRAHHERDIYQGIYSVCGSDELWSELFGDRGFTGGDAYRSQWPMPHEMGEPWGDDMAFNKWKGYFCFATFSQYNQWFGTQLFDKLGDMHYDVDLRRIQVSVFQHTERPEVVGRSQAVVNGEWLGTAEQRRCYSMSELMEVMYNGY